MAVDNRLQLETQKNKQCKNAIEEPIANCLHADEEEQSEVCSALINHSKMYKSFIIIKL